MNSNQDNEELLQFFLAELEEQLETLEQGILQLENDAENEDVIQTIFRASHNIKGSSAAMGLDVIKELAHQMENVLDRVRKNTLSVTHEVINVLFQCVDVFNKLKAFYSNESTEEVDITMVVQSLIKIQEESTQEVNQLNESTSKQETVTSLSLSLSKEDTEKLTTQQKEGKKLYACVVKIDEQSVMKEVRIQIIYNQLPQISSFHVENVQNPQYEHDEYTVCFVIATDSEESSIHAFLSKIVDVVHVDVQKWSVEEVPLETPALSEDVIPSPTTNTETKLPSSPKNSATSKTPKNKTAKKVHQTLRVDVERLEMLMNLVGEIIIDQTRISQIGSLIRDNPSDELLDEFEQTSVHMSKIVSELQENVMKTRMLPIEQLFSRFPRIVRDVSQTLQKEMELVMEGGETELDRNVIEEISDPMIHIIRNSVDHGLEMPEERKKAGKSEKGKVTISAKHENNQVILTVEDDGAGIDAQKIAQSALNKGIITQEKLETMTESDIHHLIFHSGFSTAKKVSDISGRGVGMDIVRTQIQKLNGTVDIETQKGKGTKMIIKLPLTLAIIKGLLVELNNRMYSIPTNSVVEIVRIQEEEIHMMNGREVANIRNRVLPLVWLHDHFHFPRVENERKSLTVVIIGLAEKRIGLVVDKLIGNQEIVVKSLGSYVGKIKGISGATILGDGGVALILDIISIFSMVEDE